MKVCPARARGVLNVAVLFLLHTFSWVVGNTPRAERETVRVVPRAEKAGHRASFFYTERVKGDVAKGLVDSIERLLSRKCGLIVPVECIKNEFTSRISLLFCWL